MGVESTRDCGVEHHIASFTIDVAASRVLCDTTKECTVSVHC